MSRLELAKKLFKGRSGKSKLTAIEDAHKRKESAKKAQAKADSFSAGRSRASSDGSSLSENTSNFSSSSSLSSSSSSSSSSSNIRVGISSIGIGGSTGRSHANNSSRSSESNSDAGRKRSRPNTVANEASPWSDLYQLIDDASKVSRPVNSVRVSVGTTTNHGQNLWHPLPSIMDALKQRVRSGGDEAGRAAGEYCCEQLKANSAEVRLGALEVLNWLFSRSRVVRTLVAGRLSEVISLVMGSAFASAGVDGAGVDRSAEAAGAGGPSVYARRLPGPPEVAAVLRARGAEFVRGWALDRRFSDLYPELRVALRYLEEAHRVPAPIALSNNAAANFANFAGSSAHSSTSAVARDIRMTAQVAELSLHRGASPPPPAATTIGTAGCREGSSNQQRKADYAHVGATARSARERFCRALGDLGLLQRHEEGEALNVGSSANGIGTKSKSTLIELEASVAELEEAVRLLAPSAEDELEWRGAQARETVPNHDEVFRVVHSRSLGHGRSVGDGDSGIEGEGDCEVATKDEVAGIDEGVDGEWGSDGEWEDGDPNAAAAVMNELDQPRGALESVNQPYWSSEDEEDDGADDVDDEDSGSKGGEVSNARCQKRSTSSSSSISTCMDTKNSEQAHVNIGRLPPLLVPTLAQTVATAGLGTAAAYEVEFEVSLDGDLNDALNAGEHNGGEEEGSAASVARGVLRETRKTLLKGRVQQKLKAWRLELTLARAAGLLHGDSATAAGADAQVGHISDLGFSDTSSLVPSYITRGLEARLETLQNRLENGLWKSGVLIGEPR